MSDIFWQNLNPYGRIIIATFSGVIVEVSSLMRPAPDRDKCLLCRYSGTDQYNELVCIFLLEMYLMHKIVPYVECPVVKD